MKTFCKILALTMALMLLCSALLLPVMATSDPSEPPAVSEEERDAGLDFHPESFVSSLQYMATGMVGIFLVIGIIIVATVLLNRAFSGTGKSQN